MKAAIANAAIFVPTTLMPEAEADRSFARTANIALPSALRRSSATARATPISTASTRRQKAGRGYAAPVPGPKSTPNNLGFGTVLPPVPTRSVFWNHTAWTVTASDRVTIANGRPRIRNAGIPTITPITVAPSAARIGRERERHSPTISEGAQQEPGDAGQRELRERYLPRVAGDDNDRERDDREDERGQRGRNATCRT